MISIIHPSRSRPERAFTTACKWIDQAGCDVEYILSIDKDDPHLKSYMLQPHPTVRNIMVTGNNQTAIEAINRAVKHTRGGILIVISDDFDCFPDWGGQIEEFVRGLEDWIMKTPDGIQEWIITLPIMDKKYYQRFGYIYNPNYKHGWCDTEMTCVAELTGRLIKAPLPFKHLHYSVAGGKDSVNERADAHFEQGRKVFKERLRNKFFLSDTPGKMTVNFYTTMI